MPLANSGPIKTYKELIEYLRSLAESHAAVHQFQCGEISDIDVQTNVITPTKYPVVFVVPQPSTLDRFGKMVIGLTMVVADIAKNQQELQIDTHNNTLMILQDLLSRIILTDYEVVQIDVQTPINVVPFVERFNNNLAGWSAELNIELKSPFNLCESAFN